MKKRLAILFLSAAITAPAVARSDELVILSPHWEGFKREFEWGFEAWYAKTKGREMHVRWFDVGGASDILKYVLSRAAAGESSGVDVIFGGGVDPFEELKAKGLLAPLKIGDEILKGIPITVQGNPVYDRDGYWYSINLAGFGILYNKKLLSELGIPPPSRWSDLGAPRFRGWVGSADPRKSGSVRFIYELLLQSYGWDRGWQLVYEIASNVRTFSSNSSQTPKDIALGEIAAGMMIDSYGRDLVRSLGEESVGFVVPGEIPSVFGDGAAVLIDAPHREAAELFLAFALSPDGQRLLIRKAGTANGPAQYDLGRLPVRPDQYHPGDPAEIPLANPFFEASGFSYDPHVAAGRWRYVTALLGALAVDLRYEFEHARYEKGMVLDEISPPVSEQELSLRIQKQENPASLASSVRANFKSVLGVRRVSVWRMITPLLAVFVLATLILKRYRRFLKIRNAVIT